MPRSYVREARRRGLGRRRERVRAIIARLAEEHSDAQIALRFRTNVELLVSELVTNAVFLSFVTVLPLLRHLTRQRRTETGAAWRTIAR